MIWLGKKFFNLREKISLSRGFTAEDVEKPFLEHLEDLRMTLMKMIICLLISMVGCFIFKDDLMRIVKYPITVAKLDEPDQSYTPAALKNPEEWPLVIARAHALLGLSEAEREQFLQHAFPEEQAHLLPVLRALILYRASKTLPETQRDIFLQDATAGDEALLAIVKDIASKKDLYTDYHKGPVQMRMWLGKPAEGFNLSMKLSLYAGIVVSFPLLLFFMLEFIVPGLRPEERRVLWPALGIGFTLFLIGASFSYFVVTPNALRFFFQYDASFGGETDYRLSEFASFVVNFTAIFGLCFELPVVVYALSKIGVLSYELMSNTRSYAIVAITALAAFITPTSDILNLSLLAVPMIILYEFSIWLVWFKERMERKREERERAEEEARRRARRERAAMANAYLEAAPPAHPAPAEPPAPTAPAASPDPTPPFKEEEDVLDPESPPIEPADTYYPPYSTLPSSPTPSASSEGDTPAPASEESPSSPDSNDDSRSMEPPGERQR